MEWPQNGYLEVGEKEQIAWWLNLTYPSERCLSRMGIFPKWVNTKNGGLEVLFLAHNLSRCLDVKTCQMRLVGGRMVADSH